PIARTVHSISAYGTGIDANGNGDLDAWHVMHLTLTPTLFPYTTLFRSLLLNDGGTASYNSALSNPATGSLVFDYTVVSGQNTPDLDRKSVVKGKGVQDVAGNNVNITGAPTNPAGTLQIDTIAPTVTAMAASGTGINAGGNGDLNAGHLVHLTMTLSEALTVTGTPTLLLNDGGTASYNSALSNPATGSLVFDYTVASGQNTPD